MPEPNPSVDEPDDEVLLNDDDDADEEAWEEQLLSDPRFLKRIADARESIRRGEGTRLEDIEW